VNQRIVAILVIVIVLGFGVTSILLTNTQIQDSLFGNTEFQYRADYPIDYELGLAALDIRALENSEVNIHFSTELDAIFKIDVILSQPATEALVIDDSYFTWPYFLITPARDDIIDFVDIELSTKGPYKLEISECWNLTTSATYSNGAILSNTTRFWYGSAGGVLNFTLTEDVTVALPDERNDPSILRFGGEFLEAKTHRLDEANIFIDLPDNYGGLLHGWNDLWNVMQNDGWFRNYEWYFNHFADFGTPVREGYCLEVHFQDVSHSNIWLID
jgi:hypothetical protein